MVKMFYVLIYEQNQKTNLHNFKVLKIYQGFLVYLLLRQHECAWNFVTVCYPIFKNIIY